jgi:hypothetical protein
VTTGSCYSSSIESILVMTRKTRRWFRPALLLMLAVSAQVPACEYGQNQNQDSSGQAYHMSLADPPQATATPHA